MQSTQLAAGVVERVSAMDTSGAQISHPIAGAAPTTRQPRPTWGAVSAVGQFLLHFLEMWLAMSIGMAIFGLVKAALVGLGYTTLLDRDSLDYQVWMNLFMVVPMVLWMRVRGCTWRHGVEMGGAMVIPTACVIVLCRLGVSDVLPWFTTSLTGIAMMLGMLGFMLSRRQMYTSGYSFGWIRRLRRTG